MLYCSISLQIAEFLFFKVSTIYVRIVHLACEIQLMKY